MRAAQSPRLRDVRLLVVDADGRIAHRRRTDLARVLRSGDLLVANDAATLPASLAGTHERSGEALELRLAGRRTLEVDDLHRFTAVLFGAGTHRTRTEDRAPPPAVAVGDRLRLGPLVARVLAIHDHPRLVDVGFDGDADRIWAGLARHGRPIQYAHVPEPLALWDVWTRIAALPVAFEAPSAGFVLDWALVDALGRNDIGLATLTHAAGLSSTGDATLDARLPFDEPYRIPSSTVREILHTRARGARIVALGTTVARALEHAARDGAPRSGDGVADQRLDAHSSLRIVDAIVSGTHEPGTSHHALLRAFVDDETLARVDAALERGDYLTHEFGDAVLIERARVRASGERVEDAEVGAALG